MTMTMLVPEPNVGLAFAVVAMSAAEICFVGGSLLEFFTRLSIAVRTTPAPCPWCGSTADRTTAQAT